jgi:hypothetical protein
MHPHLEAGESQRRKQPRKLSGLKIEASSAIPTHVEVLSQLFDASALMMDENKLPTFIILSFRLR